MSYCAKTSRAWEGARAAQVAYLAGMPIFCYEYVFLIILSRYAKTLFKNRSQTSARFRFTGLSI